MRAKQCIEVLEGRAGLLCIALAKGGDMHLTGIAVEERLTQLGFQRLNGARHALR